MALPASTRGTALSGAVSKILQRHHEQRHDPVLVKTRRRCVGEEAGNEVSPERGQLLETDSLGRGEDEGALTRPGRDETLLLEVSVRLGHGVRVDRERADDVLHARQLVSLDQIAETERVLDLMDELQVRRHPRARIEPEDH